MPQRIAVIDPGSGNIASLQRALQRAATAAGIAAEIAVVREGAALTAADRIVLPGQGAFAACRRALMAAGDLLPVLEQQVRGRGVPFLGICVGMQLMANRGFEHGETPGLGWIPGRVAALDPRGPAGEALPLPHMGWNGLFFAPGCHPLFTGVVPGDHVYFVHSFAFEAGNPRHVIATTDYGGPVTAAIAHGNLWGVQFHVEKSGSIGLRMLANFLRWEP